MLNYLSKTHINSSAGAAKFYFIGIGALVVILIVAAAAILLSPDLKNSLNLSGGDKLERSRVAGEIIDINYDDDYFVIDDEDSGEEFLVNLPEGTEITTQGLNGNRTYKLGDLELGQFIELKNVKYTSSGNSDNNGGSDNNGNNDSNNDGRDDEDQNEIDDWEDIDIYFPYPAFSSTILSIDGGNKSVEVETTTTAGKTFTILVSDETLIVPIGSTNNSATTLEFNDLSVGQLMDIFSETDPTTSSILDVSVLVVYK